MFKEIIGIFSWLKDKLPIPNRVEGIKNEIDKLKAERSKILVFKAEVKKGVRLTWINKRLSLLRRRLSNIAS